MVSLYLKTIVNIIVIIQYNSKSKTIEKLYLKQSINYVLSMPCNALYNALYKLMNNCNHSKYVITLINSLLHYVF